VRSADTSAAHEPVAGIDPKRSTSMVPETFEKLRVPLVTTRVKTLAGSKMAVVAVPARVPRRVTRERSRTRERGL
jgi:hypothetical protein